MPLQVGTERIRDTNVLNIIRSKNDPLKVKLKSGTRLDEFRADDNEEGFKPIVDRYEEWKQKRRKRKRRTRKEDEGSETKRRKTEGSVYSRKDTEPDQM